MNPFLYLLSIASFALSIAAVTLFVLVHLEHRTRILKYYVFFITNVAVFSLIDIIHAYLLNYYKVVPIPISIIFWELIFLFSGSLIYFYAILIWSLLKLKHGLLIQRITIAAALFIVISGIIPFCVSQTPEKILHTLEYFSHVILDPLEFVYGFFMFVVLLKNYKKTHLSVIRTTIRANIVLIAISILLLLVLNVIALYIPLDVNLSTYIYFEILYILWNLGSIIYFLSLARETASNAAGGGTLNKHISFNKAEQVLSDTLQKYEKSGMSDNEAKESFKLLLAYMANKKPYLDPDISLESLSGQTRIPRHHLSRIINQYKKCNFYDFLNGYRIEEFKNIMRINRNITILEAALESGYNSKTAFYSAFRKATGITPLEFSKKITK
jgi:AraC-like DNA-binding protein